MVAKALLDAKLELEKVAAQLDVLAERIAKVARILEDLAIGRAAGLRTSRAPSWAAEQKVLHEQGRIGVTRLEVVSNPDGSADVRIDGGRRFRLRPQLAALLRIIAADEGDDVDDGLVGWKALPHVAATLARETSAPTTRRHVNQTVYRLREAFVRERQNRFLIQRRRSDVRFALRHGDGGAPGEAPVTGP